MPVVQGRLTCCGCGADLGDAEDPYRDPSCAQCERRQAIAEAEAEDERDRWNDAELREQSLEAADEPIANPCPCGAMTANDCAGECGWA